MMKTSFISTVSLTASTDTFSPLVDFPEIKQGEKVNADAVKLTVEVREVFIIKGIAYYILFFKIILE